MKHNKNEAIILIHGLWMTGFELFFLQLKLWLQGYRVYLFHYHSIFRTPEQNAEKLYSFVSQIKEPTIHFVAHSLGGIVVSHLFEHHQIEKKGKVVMIASPINGGVAANSLAQNKFLKYFLGKSVIKGLLGDAPRWNYKREICVIAGTQGLGIGSILAHKVMQSPNDGTVNLDETYIEKAEQSHEVARSHFSLLISNKVIKIMTKFLDDPV